jgi:hypothetical protein
VPRPKIVSAQEQNAEKKIYIYIYGQRGEGKMRLEKTA